MDVITYPCWNLSYSMLVKGPWLSIFKRYSTNVSYRSYNMITSLIKKKRYFRVFCDDKTVDKFLNKWHQINKDDSSVNFLCTGGDMLERTWLSADILFEQSLLEYQLSWLSYLMDWCHRRQGSCLTVHLHLNRTELYHTLSVLPSHADNHCADYIQLDHSFLALIEVNRLHEQWHCKKQISFATFDDLFKIWHMHYTIKCYWD